MDNRERVITTLNHNRPDRVPYHIWMNESIKQKMVQFYGDSEFESKLGNCFYDAGNYANNYKPVGKSIWRDQFGVLWDRNGQAESGSVCNSIVDCQNIKEYKFPDPKSCLGETLGGDRVAIPQDQFSFIQLGFSLFERAWTLAGMENFLMSMISDEDFANELLDRILEFNLEWIAEAGTLGVDAIFFGDDWGQQTDLIMGPHLWRKYIGPRFVRMCRAVKDTGKFVFLHSCGKVQSIFPDLIECEVDLFNPFQPEVMDVFRIKKQYGENISFFGGISIQKTLPFATVCKRRSKSVPPGGAIMYHPAPI